MALDAKLECKQIVHRVRAVVEMSRVCLIYSTCVPYTQRKVCDCREVCDNTQQMRRWNKTVLRP